MSVRLHLSGRLFQELARKAETAAAQFLRLSLWAQGVADRFQKKAENFFQQVKGRQE